LALTGAQNIFSCARIGPTAARRPSPSVLLLGASDGTDLFGVEASWSFTNSRHDAPYRITCMNADSARLAGRRAQRPVGGV